MIFQKLSAAIFLVVLGREMTLEAFGMLMLGVTSTNLLSLLALLGLPAASSRFLSGRLQEDMSTNASAIINLGLVYVLFALAILIPLSASIAPVFSDTQTFHIVFFVAVMGIPFQAGFRIFESILQAREGNLQLLLLAIADGCFKILWPVGLYAATQSVPGAMLGVVLAYLSSALTALFLVGRHSPFVYRLPRPRIMMGIARFAIPTMVVGFSYVLASQADRLMVGAFRPNGEVGAYAAAAVFAMLLSLVHTAFTRIFLPLASDSYRTGNAQELDSIYQFASRWSAGVSGFGVLLFAAFGNKLLALVFGPEFQTTSAHATMVILSLFYFTAALFGPTTSVLQMGGSHHIEGGNAVLFLVTNIGLNLMLIPRLGMTGAALATLLSGLTRNALQAIQLKLRHKMNAIRLDQILLTAAVVLGLFLQWILPANLFWMGTATACIAIGALLLARISHDEKVLTRNLGTRIQAAFQTR